MGLPGNVADHDADEKLDEGNRNPETDVRFGHAHRPKPHRLDDLNHRLAYAGAARSVLLVLFLYERPILDLLGTEDMAA